MHPYEGERRFRPYLERLKVAASKAATSSMKEPNRGGRRPATSWAAYSTSHLCSGAGRDASHFTTPGLACGSLADMLCTSTGPDPANVASCSPNLTSQIGLIAFYYNLIILSHTSVASSILQDCACRLILYMACAAQPVPLPPFLPKCTHLVPDFAP